MAGTTVAVARAHIKGLLIDNSDKGDAQVHYAWPGDDKTGHRFICCTGVEDDENEIAAIKAGRQRREESYVLRWLCAVRGLGGTPEAVDADAVSLRTCVEETIADNGTLTGIPVASDQQIISCKVVGVESSEGPIEGGWSFGYVVRVGVRARLL